MVKFEDLLEGRKPIAVVGLGYVGLSLSVELSKAFKDVVGFDISKKRVEELRQGFDITEEVPSEDLKTAPIKYSADPEDLKKASFIIIAVPTPINSHNFPDLEPLRHASQIVGENLSNGSIVVYESTVYPGVTEEFCAPILERYSGLKLGIDFKVGYSPERVNPGDKEHTLTKIIKVVSGQDEETTDTIAQVYGRIIPAGIFKTKDIRTAEAAKVIENIQRDLNIALMNELSIIFHRLGLDSREVFDAASTKWNFLRFEPGLVGGHCIGVDPYYLTFKAQELGYHPEVILAGREINDFMGKYIAEQTVKQLIKAGKSVKGAKVLILGITFKEDIKDIRNSRVVDIVNELKEYGVEVFVHDPYALRDEVRNEYNIELLNDLDGLKVDGIIAAVKHREYIEKGVEGLTGVAENPCILMDVKGIYNREMAEGYKFLYWRL
jgi:UDP-N-acetyl-D-galactosamine dehydrogenase